MAVSYISHRSEHLVYPRGIECDTIHGIMATYHTSRKGIATPVAVIVIGLITALAIVYVALRQPSITPENESPAVIQPNEELLLPPEDSGPSIVLTVNEQNQSGVKGKATLMESAGRAKIILELTGAPQGVVQPAYIHAGQCPHPGLPKYPLVNVKKGFSQTVLNISVSELMDQLPLAISVRMSEVEGESDVACGDISGEVPS